MTGYIEPTDRAATCMSISTASRTGSISRKPGRAFRLVCLHTAGSRQPAVALSPWRMKSSPSTSASSPSTCPGTASPNPPANWDGSEYQLTTARYTQTIRAFCAALDLDKPVVMGCSIGGRIVLNLAIDHASEFRALIGLEAADFQAPWYDTTWLNRPDIHGGEVCAALVSRSRCAANLLPEARMETLWAYKQGGPGVFKGDLYFYRVDGDLRGRTRAIDTKICPLYLLTGEYDFSCMPEDTVRTATGIAGAEVTVMEQLGPFPDEREPRAIPPLHRAGVERNFKTTESLRRRTMTLTEH